MATKTRIVVQIRGTKEVKRNTRKAAKRYTMALGASLYVEGFETMAVSVRQTPWRFGILRRSHYVAPPRGRKLVVEIGYGVRYALPVHEKEEVQHVIGNAKFLENAVRSRSSGYRGRVARRAQSYFEKGIGVRAIPVKAPTRPKFTGDGPGAQRSS